MLSVSQPLVLTLDGTPLIFKAFMNRRENAKTTLADLS